MWQIISVVIIIVGLLIAIFPSFTHKVSSADVGTFYWNSLFLIGSFPISICYVYEEKAFGEQKIHIASMLAWGTWWQTVTILMLAPLDAIPHFGTANGIKQVFTNQWEALKCFGRQEIDMSLCPQCECDDAWIYIMLFVLGYVASSFFTLGVVKYGNAAFSFITTTLVTPLVEFAFSWRFLMGQYVESMSPYNYGSLFVLLAGVIIYRVFDKAIHEAKSNTEILQDSQQGEVNTLMVGSALPAYATFQPHLFVRKTKPETDLNRANFYTYP